MFDRVHRLALILILISRFSQQLEAPESIRKLEPFSCERRVEEIENLKIKAFFETEGQFVILLDDRLILFDGPFCYEHFENKESCIIRIPLTKKIDHGLKYPNLKLKGFKSESEFINLRKSIKETYIVYGDSGNLIVNRIYFWNGTRAKPEDGMIKEENTTNIANPEKDDVFKVFKDESYVLLTNHRSYIRFEFHHNTSGLRIYLNPQRNGAFFRTPFNTSNLMAFFEYQTFDLSYENTNNTLIVISDSKMHISYLKFLDARDSTDLAEYQIELKSYSMRLTDFFNCHIPFEKNDAVKGLFQHGDTFYVFINRFYIVIKDDLVETSFKLKDEYYESGKDLVFKNDVLEKIAFETRRSKWVLNLLDEHYLLLMGQLFKVAVEAGGLKMVDTRSTIHQNCNWQTLKIISNEYCFTPRYYYSVLKNDFSFSYTQLFENSNIKLDGDLQFIFNYRSRAFVMMTMDSFYVIPYSITEERKNESFIRLTPTSSFPIVSQKNHLFDTLKSELEKKAEDYKTVYLLSAFFAVILMVVILVLFYKREKMVSQMVVSNTDLRYTSRDSKGKPEIGLPKKDIELKARYRQLFKGFDLISRSFSFFKGLGSKGSRTNGSNTSTVSAYGGVSTNVGKVNKLEKNYEQSEILGGSKTDGKVNSSAVDKYPTSKSEKPSNVSKKYKKYVDKNSKKEKSNSR